MGLTSAHSLVSSELFVDEIVRVYTAVRTFIIKIDAESVFAREDFFLDGGTPLHSQLDDLFLLCMSACLMIAGVLSLLV